MQKKLKDVTLEENVTLSIDIDNVTEVNPDRVSIFELATQFNKLVKAIKDEEENEQ